MPSAADEETQVVNFFCFTLLYKLYVITETLSFLKEIEMIIAVILSLKVGTKL